MQRYQGMVGTHPSGKFVLYSDAMQEIEKRDRLVAEKDLMYRNVLGTYQRLCVEWGERGDQIAALEQANTIANNTINLMAKEIAALEGGKGEPVDKA